MRALTLAAAVAASLIAIAPARAQDYPKQTVHIAVGFVPGASTDIVARMMAAEWSRQLGQQFVVENRPGAASAIAADQVARAPKDGYALLAGGGVNVSSGLLNPKQTFDIERDFTPVILIAGQPMILAVHPSLGVSSVKELVALAKAKPGELSYGSTGVGATPHLLTELFQLRTGTKMVHVPYQGSPQATTDLLAGRVQLMFSPATAVLPHIQSGALKGLAVSSAQALQRRARSGDLARRRRRSRRQPVVRDLGAGRHAAGGDRRALAHRQCRDQGRGGAEALRHAGLRCPGGTPEDFARLQADELAKWKSAVEAAGLKK